MLSQFKHEYTVAYKYTNTKFLLIQKDPVLCYCQLRARTLQIQGDHGFKLLWMHLLLFLTSNIVHEEKGKFWPAGWSFLCKTVTSGFVAHALGYFESDRDSEHGRHLARQRFPNNSTNCKCTPKQMDLCFGFRFPTAN